MKSYKTCKAEDMQLIEVHLFPEAKTERSTENLFFFFFIFF